MKKKPKNAVVNWTKLVTRYNLKSLKSNDAPGNGGQVLNGIEIYQLNTHMKLSDSDILHRERRSKKRVLKSSLNFHPKICDMSINSWTCQGEVMCLLIRGHVRVR